MEVPTLWYERICREEMTVLYCGAAPRGCHFRELSVLERCVTLPRWHKNSISLLWLTPHYVTRQGKSSCSGRATSDVLVLVVELRLSWRDVGVKEVFALWSCLP